MPVLKYKSSSGEWKRIRIGGGVAVSGGGGSESGVGQETPEGGEIFNNYENNQAVEMSHAEGNSTNALGRYSHTECLGETNIFDNVLISNTRINEKRFDINVDISKIKLPYVAILYQNDIIISSMLVKEIKNKNNIFTLIGYEQPTNLVDGEYSLALVKGTTIKEAAHAEGTKTIANARHAHTEGDKTIVTKNIAKDGTVIGTGIAGHAEGTETFVCGENSHAEGFRTIALGKNSHAEGAYTEVSGNYSHTEGVYTKVSGGYGSHAEGFSTKAFGDCSHAEGNDTLTSGENSHAEGNETLAIGLSSHAEGKGTETIGAHSHAEGYNTIALEQEQHVEGAYNENPQDGLEYAHIIGNGTSEENRSNCAMITKDGKIIAAEGFYTLVYNRSKRIEHGELEDLNYLNDATYYISAPSVTIFPEGKQEDFYIYTFGGSNPDTNYKSNQILRFSSIDNSVLKLSTTIPEPISGAVAQFNPEDELIYLFTHETEDKVYTFNPETEIIQYVTSYTGCSIYKGRAAYYKHAFYIMSEDETLYKYDIKKQTMEALVDIYEINDAISDIRIQGHYAYIETQDESGSESEMEAYRVDLNDPTNYICMDNMNRDKDGDDVRYYSSFFYNGVIYSPSESRYDGDFKYFIYELGATKHDYDDDFKIIDYRTNPTSRPGLPLVTSEFSAKYNCIFAILHDNATILKIFFHNKYQPITDIHLYQNPEYSGTIQAEEATASSYGACALSPETQATGFHSFTTGEYTEASGDYSHAEGTETIASGKNSHAEGYGSIASGSGFFTSSHAEGCYTQASGENSHSEGDSTYAIGDSSHSEGGNTYAVGSGSHSEGMGTENLFNNQTLTAFNQPSPDLLNFYFPNENFYKMAYSNSLITIFPLNNDTPIATGFINYYNYPTLFLNNVQIFSQSDLISGNQYDIVLANTGALGDISHSEGLNTSAVGNFSHTEGIYTVAIKEGQHVEGIYNITDTEKKYIHIVGNGTSEENRSNAYTLDENGNAQYAGTIEGKALILPSSTPGSNKKFKITIDDTKTLKIEEII